MVVAKYACYCGLKTLLLQCKSNAITM